MTLRQTTQDEIIQAIKWSVKEMINESIKPNVHFFADVQFNNQRLSAGSKIVFNYVIDQLGGGYNKRDGVFTCPVTGVYFISVVLANDNPTNTWITGLLKVDSTTKANILSRNHHSHEHDQGSNLAILQLFEGQKVWVEIHRNTNVEIFKQFSTFAGVLLH